MFRNRFNNSQRKVVPLRIDKFANKLFMLSALWIIGELAIGVGIIFIVVHFIAKYW